jgi:uncharacterized protein YjbI with pentapeptide repeats
MADPRALSSLSAGREPWERWRKEFFRAKPDRSEFADSIDLRQADLRNMDLVGFNLRAVDFTGLICQGHAATERTRLLAYSQAQN